MRPFPSNKGESCEEGFDKAESLWGMGVGFGEGEGGFLQKGPFPLPDSLPPSHSQWLPSGRIAGYVPGTSNIL